MYRTDRLLLTFFLALTSFTIAHGQQPQLVNITLAEATAEALNNNKAIRVAQTDERIAEANFRQTNAVFLPQVGLSYTAMTSNNPLNVFGFKLQQQSVTATDFNPALLNNPAATQNYMTKVDVMQPLLNMDMLYMRKGAQKQIESYHFKTERTKEYITFEVQKAYLQLQLTHQAVTVMEEALQSAKATYTSTENRFQKGLLQKSDLLNVKIQVNAIETKLAEAKSNVSNASGHLSLLMGKPSNVIYAIDKAIQPTTEATETAPVLSITRSDFKAMQNAIDASDYMTQSSKMNYLPKLNAFGTYQINDSEALGFGSNAYLAGIQLSWDVFKGTKTRNEVSAKNLTRDKMQTQFDEQKEQSQLELDKTNRQLADTRFAIQQQQTAVAQAEEALRILQNRYEQGLITTTDVLMAGSQLSQQKLGLAQALFSHNVTAAYLQFLTSSN